MDADALAAKRLLVPLEDASDLGRLYDIDIIGRDGKKISRSDIGSRPDLSPLRPPCAGMFQKPGPLGRGADGTDQRDLS